MKIVIVGGSPDHLGGVETYCQRAAELLSKGEEWQVTHIHTNSAYLKLNGLFRFSVGVYKLLKFRAEHPDWVWLQFVNLPDLVYLFVARRLKMRVAITPHLGSNWRSQKNAVLRRITSHLLQDSNRFLLLSRTQESEIQLPPAVDKRYVRTLLPYSFLASKLKRKSSHVLQLTHACRLSKSKGTMLFLEVCLRLRDDGLIFHARIAGQAEPSFQEQLFNFVEEHSLHTSVTFLGQLSQDALRECLDASDVLIHLSLTDSYPLIVLEALARGVFPVCIALPGAQDIIKNYDGHLVESVTAVEDTFRLINTANLVEIQLRAREASSKLRCDYAWTTCKAQLQSAFTG